MSKLEVLIAAYGPEALDRIAALSHPKLEGVSYIVSWQKHEGAKIPEEFKNRDDFLIYKNNTIGLCNNRNFLLKKSSADYLLISDDDISYTPFHLETVIQEFEKHPQYSFLTFRYHSEKYPKHYPSCSFEISNPPKGYFITSMELAINRKHIQESGSLDDWSFNTYFGVNGICFGSGEEGILMSKAIRKGYKGKYIPKEICINTDSTTADRIEHTPGFIETKGAAMLYMKPWTWPGRMLTHAWRARKHGIAFFKYCSWWITGVKKAINNNVFADET